MKTLSKKELAELLADNGKKNWTEAEFEQMRYFLKNGITAATMGRKLGRFFPGRTKQAIEAKAKHIQNGK